MSIREICYEVLTADGYEVITASRGDQVFPLIREERPDLILMDLRIPGEKEFSLLRSMPNDPSARIPVIIFSGSLTPESEKEALELGAIDVIHKGVGFDEIKSKVRKALSAEKQSAEKKPEKRGGKILIVDDEKNIRSFLHQFFKEKGFEALVAASGEEALPLVEHYHPTIILLDMMMPGMDGMLTLKKIREIDSKVGVVIATGLQNEELLNEAKQFGVYEYVIKPFDLKYLELVVFSKLLMAGQ